MNFRTRLTCASGKLFLAAGVKTGNVGRPQSGERRATMFAADGRAPHPLERSACAEEAPAARVETGNVGRPRSTERRATMSAADGRAPHPLEGNAWYALYDGEGQEVYSGSASNFLTRYSEQHRRGRVHHTRAKEEGSTFFIPLFVLTGWETKTDAVRFETVMNSGSAPGFWAAYQQVEPSARVHSPHGRGIAPANMSGRPVCLLTGNAEDMLVRLAVLLTVRQHHRGVEASNDTLTLHTSMSPKKVVCLHACLFVCMFVCMFVWLSVCLSPCLHACLCPCATAASYDTLFNPPPSPLPIMQR